VVADFRSSQQSSALHPGPDIRAAPRATKSFVRNILRVSTFVPKILPRPYIASFQWNQRFGCLRSRATYASTTKKPNFPQLSPMLSTFCLQLLWIQRFCSYSPAKSMIPEDHREEGYIVASAGSGQVPNVREVKANGQRQAAKKLERWQIVPLTPLLSRFYQKSLWNQRFCSYSPAKLMIPEDRRGRVYTVLISKRHEVQPVYPCAPIRGTNRHPSSRWIIGRPFNFRTSCSSWA